MKKTIVVCDRCGKRPEKGRPATVAFTPAYHRGAPPKGRVLDLCLECSAGLATWLNGAPKR